MSLEQDWYMFPILVLLKELILLWRFYYILYEWNVQKSELDVYCIFAVANCISLCVHKDEKDVEVTGSVQVWLYL